MTTMTPPTDSRKTRKRPGKRPRCVHCQRIADVANDYCYGCRRFVCMGCVVARGHHIGGRHGVRPSLGGTGVT